MTEPEEWLVTPGGRAHLLRGDGHSYCGKYSRADLRPGDTSNRCKSCTRWRELALARRPSPST